MGGDNITFSRAEKYDGQIEKVAPLYAEFHRQAVDLAKSAAPDPGVWLDTGCGTGRLAGEALPEFPRTLFLLADPSPAMLDLARKRLRKYPEERLRFLPPADTEGLEGVVTEKPRVVSAMISHHYLSPAGRRKAVEAVFRLLPAGGLFITFEVTLPRTEEGKRIAMDRWRRFQLESGRSEEDVARHQARIGTEVKPVTVQEHLQVLNGAGFSVAENFFLAGMNAGFYAIK